MRGPGGERQRILDEPSECGVAITQSHLGVRVGLELARLRQELIDTGGSLCRVLEPQGSGLVTDAVRLLERQVCRVAIIGQIKAGKSLFINALAQRPGLLPTDVNPWTAAVTNLHFRPRQESDDEAVFRFFTASEWEQLATGGGKLRELTERLVPGFEPELLRLHVSALKTRAAARLGADFVSLLGQQHRFATLSPDTLAQYVCQGDLDELDAPDRSVGRYSEITKAADIFLPPGPFAYPMTIIDTPGTNDPFLVRDEITRRSLESADLYVVVLTARQALAASDVALLRILRGLNKERIIVFVNRIDELSEIRSDIDAVIASVQRRLRVEFPGPDIPLISGSAWWASCSLADATASFEDCLNSRTISYLQQMRLLQREDLVRPVAGDEHAGAGLRSALLAASGLPAVYAALDALLGASYHGRELRQMTSWLIEMARASENGARQELQSLARRAGPTTAAAPAPDELPRLRGELARLQEVSAVIDSSATLFRDRQMDIVASELKALRRHLMQTVTECALFERDALVDELMKGRSVRTWTFDSDPIRRRLAYEFVDGFRGIEDKLLALQHEVVPQLRRLLALLAPNSRAAQDDGFMHRPVPPPLMTPLGATMALDLGEAWWSFLFRTRPTPLQRGREVERIFRTEFGRAVEELLAGCEQSLSEHVEQTTEWSFGVCDIIARSIALRREQLVRYYENLSDEPPGAADPQAATERQRYATTLDERAQQCGALSDRLEQIAQEIARDLPSALG